MSVELTDRQREAIEHEGGPLLVLGGPGTGKTLTLERRFLRLACTPGLAPHRILFLCNSRAYSQQVKDRLAWGLPQRATVEIPVYTWHALCYHLVTRHYRALGLEYREPPVLLTAPEQWGVVRELLAMERPADWPTWGDQLSQRAFVDEVADFCLRVTQRLMRDEDLDALSLRRPDWEEVVRFYRRYRDHLRRECRIDYATLIASAARMLQRHEEVRRALALRFLHVLVDEGEEMSPAHRELLAGMGIANLTVAADPDCAVESCRGAQPDWVLGFEKWFDAHSRVILDRTHRLGPGLGAAVGEMIAHNDGEGWWRPTVYSERETDFTCRLYGSCAEEMAGIGRELRRLQLLHEADWHEMAVLVSQPAQLLPALQRALEHWEVPYIAMAPERPLAAEPAVSCFLDLVRVALDEEGSEALLGNLLTSPLVGLDYGQRRHLERRAWQEHRSLAEVVEEAEEAAGLRMLADLVRSQAKAAADECFWQVYAAAPYYQRLVASIREEPFAPGQDRGGTPANAQVDALMAFGHALGRFVERRHGRATIREYLREATRADFGADPWLAPRTDDRAGGVQLLSFHGAKGREWDVVVVAGCLDAWIPKGRRAQGLFDPFSLEMAEVTQRQIEAIADDRRTFYLAATRARRKAIFTVSPGPGGRGRPSRFLTELAGEAIAVASLEESLPLTERELRASLRRTLQSRTSLSEEKVAALIAASELPGTDPARWYGRWGWTEGAVALEDGGQLRTSYSRLSVYENCGLQYMLQTILGLDPISTYAMKFGTWMHALFQNVHEGVISDRPTLFKAYDDLFEEGAFPNAAIARQYRRDGERMLEVFLEHEVKAGRTVRTEHFFEIPHAGAILRGRIDRIDKIGPNIVLADYKTARYAPGLGKAPQSLQLAIYHLAAREDSELRELGKPVSARLVYPGDTWADGRPKQATQSPEEADKVLKRLPMLVEGVMAERFAPSPEADCLWCRMKPLCPLWPEGRELGFSVRT
ncbi:MAG: ATP-dependent helicase [Actinomycetota bacterium]